MESSALVFQDPLGIANWPSPPCCQSSLAQSHLLAVYDQPPKLFLRQDHPIPLYSEFHLDLQWWDEFLSSWHGVSFWLFPGMAVSSDVEVTSDATGSLRFGAYFRIGWFSGAWAPCQAGCSIAYKELFPILIAAFIWGPQWSCQHILFRSDNEAVVHILTTRTSRTVDLMFLLRKLLLAAARFNFTFMGQHVPGVHNTIADALSRFHWQEFRCLDPYVQRNPVPVPVPLWQDLISPLLRQGPAVVNGGLGSHHSQYLSVQSKEVY